MKLNSLIVILNIFASISMASERGELRIPLNFEGFEKVAEVNKILATTEFPQFDSVIELKNPETAYQDMSALYQRVSKISEQVPELKYLNVSSELYPGEGTCYLGKPEVAIDMIFSLVDNYYSDQMSLIGWKYKNKKHLIDESAESDYSDSFPEIWKNWKGKGEAILLLTSVGDSGDDVQVSIIRKCVD